MVKKIKDDLYEIIRLPYSNLNVNTYLGITSMLYVFVIIIASIITMMTDATLQEVNKFTGSTICPFAVYCLPGYLYYKISTDNNTK